MYLLYFDAKERVTKTLRKTIVKNAIRIRIKIIIKTTLISNTKISIKVTSRTRDCAIHILFYSCHSEKFKSKIMTLRTHANADCRKSWIQAKQHPEIRPMRIWPWTYIYQGIGRSKSVEVWGIPRSTPKPEVGKPTGKLASELVGSGEFVNQNRLVADY